MRKRPIYPIYFPSNYTPESPIIIEEWRVVNLEGVVPNYYWVSNTGELRNIKGQIIKPTLINSGYLVYRLYTGDKNKKYKRILAHRLVKMVFDPIENPELYTVNHEDLDPLENALDNLTWMSQSENNEHKQMNMRLDGSRNYQALFSNSDLRIIIRELEKGTSYKEILNILGIEDTWNNRDYIGNIKRGKTYQKEIKDILNE